MQLSTIFQLYGDSLIVEGVHREHHWFVTHEMVSSTHFDGPETDHKTDWCKSNYYTRASRVASG